MLLYFFHITGISTSGFSHLGSRFFLEVLLSCVLSFEGLAVFSPD
jgi:hypothetical protein